MNQKKRLQIGVIGYAGAEEYPTEQAPAARIYDMAEEAGYLLARAGATVVTGGKSGIMDRAAAGAKRGGGITVGVIKGGRRFQSNAGTDVEILSGMAADGMDELLLVLMCDGFIVVGGGAGTLEELSIAYRNNKPIVAIAQSGGWADITAGTFLDERSRVKIEVAQTPEEAVSLILSKLTDVQ
jgi:hypothetical protein